MQPVIGAIAMCEFAVSLMSIHPTQVLEPPAKPARVWIPLSFQLQNDLVPVRATG